MVEIIEKLSIELNEFYDKTGVLTEERFSQEVFGAWCSTIFSAQNNRPEKISKQEAETKTIEGTLESKGMKKVNGKYLYHVKVDDQFYNTFNKDAFGGIKFDTGQRVKAKIQKNSKGYWNLIELTPMTSHEEPDDIPF